MSLSNGTPLFVPQATTSSRAMRYVGLGTPQSYATQRLERRAGTRL
jgi:hypothetical protein